MKENENIVLYRGLPRKRHLTLFEYILLSSYLVGLLVA